MEHEIEAVGEEAAREGVHGSPAVSVTGLISTVSGA